MTELTHEQQATEKKIRASAWKDYLNEKRWCAWFQGKPSASGGGKIPLCDTTNPNSWSTFNEVCAKLKPGQGWGFCFLGGDLHPWDFDHVRNRVSGNICPEVMNCLSRFNSFAEVSVSGTGLHVFTKGTVRGKKLNAEGCGLDYWNPSSEARYFTVTGEVVGAAFSTIKDIGNDGDYVFAIANHINAKCREELASVDPDQYANLAPASAKKATRERVKSNEKKRQRHTDFSMEEFLSWAALPVDNITTNEIGKCYRVTTCPIKGDRHVGQNGTTTNFGETADGGLMFHCQSTGCVEYHFADVLKMLEEKHGKYPKPIYEAKQTASVKQTVTIVRADRVKREATKWLIPEFVLLNECTAFSGDMDTRKSTTAIDIAAKGSMGRLWNKVLKTPKADVRMVQTPPFSTLYAGTEDSFASTVINRFVAAGGSLTALGRIALDVKHAKESPDGLIEWSTTLSYDAHLNTLHDAILTFNKEAEWPVGLLINDPLIGFFGDKNFNKAQDCQVIMSGLKKLCEELHISIINLMHYNKTQGASAKEKTGGSQRLIEAHRQAWSFTLVNEEDKESNTLIAPIKKNLLKVAKSYEITTISTPVEWVEDGVKKSDDVGVFKFVRFSDETAEGQLLEKASKDRSKHAQVREDVLRILAKGKCTPADVINQIGDAASRATIERVASKLINSGKVISEGKTTNKVWMLATEPHQVEAFDK